MSEFEIVNHETGQPEVAPVALWYLDRMGIGTESVEEIIVTHFHLDHYGGVDLLHDHYREARMLVTAALRHEVVTQVYADHVANPVFGCIPATLKQARRRKCGGEFENGLKYVGDGFVHQYPGRVALTALSPVDAALSASMEEIAARMVSGRANLRKRIRSENWCSVVLHIETPAGSVLLCADLETKPAKYGWKAVMAERGRQVPLSAASLVKVGHHGSSNADHQPMWDELVVDRADMMLAPFAKGRKKLPTKADIRRLCDRGQLYQCAPTVERITNSVGYRSASEGPTGIVRARRRVGEPSWRIRLEGQAFHVNPLVVT